MWLQRKIVVISAVIIAVIVFFVSCLDAASGNQSDVRGVAYAGAASCATCHKSEYNSYLHTAHHNTSRTASDSSVAGSFTAPANEFFYADTMKVVMEKREGHLYQTAYINGQKGESHLFDIAIGSGRKAQTYLYHQGNEIHQLPVSYFVPAASWANSPGFPATRISFDRNIPSACFGCHASAANVQTVQTGSLSLSEKYLPGQQLLGIDCERCHGPANAHVEYHSAHPAEKQAKFITAINTLNRLQKMDMCGLCHSGIKKSQQSVFNFKPGDSLDNFYYPDFMNTPADKMDVHGTQVQFLMASKCYRQSKDLTCITCHNTHVNERENMALFSQKCMNCHNEANHNFCSKAPELGENIKSNCIDCHMPAKPSKVITLLTNGKESARPDYIRTHVIAVYNDETEKLLQYFKKDFH